MKKYKIHQYEFDIPDTCPEVTEEHIEMAMGQIHITSKFNNSQYENFLLSVCEYKKVQQGKWYIPCIIILQYLEAEGLLTYYEI